MDKLPAVPGMTSSALDIPSLELDIPSLEKELRATVRKLMESSAATPREYARLDALLNRKLALMRAPLDAKLRRIYSRAS